MSLISIIHWRPWMLPVYLGAAFAGLLAAVLIPPLFLTFYGSCSGSAAGSVQNINRAEAAYHARHGVYGSARDLAAEVDQHGFPLLLPPLAEIINTAASEQFDCCSYHTPIQWRSHDSARYILAAGRDWYYCLAITAGRGMLYSDHTGRLSSNRSGRGPIPTADWNGRCPPGFER